MKRTMRRVSSVIALAFASSLALGSVAYAAEPATSATTTEGAAATQATTSDSYEARDGRTFRQRGTVGEVRVVDRRGEKTVLLTLESGGRDLTWVVGDRARVTEDGKRVPADSIEEGDHVTATGVVHAGPRGVVAHAKSVEIG